VKFGPIPGSSIKYLSLLAGLLFGWLGWGLLKLPITEPAGLVLLYFPVRVVCRSFHIPETDSVAVPCTIVLYGVVGFFIGLMAGKQDR